MGGKVKNETGNRYGRLIVTKEAGRARWGNVLWRCVCDCGNMVVIRGSSLRSGNTKSCGCLRQENPGMLPPGQANFNKTYLNYENHAKQRGLSFDLTKEDFSFLTKMNCFYCGAKPGQVARKKRCNGTYIYNGIDRMDNSKGYTIDNVVPCCKACNWMKLDMTTLEFLGHVRKIVRYKGQDKNGNRRL